MVSLYTYLNIYNVLVSKYLFITWSHYHELTPTLRTNCSIWRGTCTIMVLHVQFNITVNPFNCGHRWDKNNVHNKEKVGTFATVKKKIYIYMRGIVKWCPQYKGVQFSKVITLARFYCTRYFTISLIINRLVNTSLYFCVYNFCLPWTRTNFLIRGRTLTRNDRRKKCTNCW